MQGSAQRVSVQTHVLNANQQAALENRQFFAALDLL